MHFISCWLSSPPSGSVTKLLSSCLCRRLLRLLWSVELSVGVFPAVSAAQDGDGEGTDPLTACLWRRQSDGTFTFIRLTAPVGDSNNSVSYYLLGFCCMPGNPLRNLGSSSHFICIVPVKCRCPYPILQIRKARPGEVKGCIKDLVAIRRRQSLNLNSGLLVPELSLYLPCPKAWGHHTQNVLCACLLGTLYGAFSMKSCVSSVRVLAGKRTHSNQDYSGRIS